MREKYWIDQYKSTDKRKGYNLTKGGDNHEHMGIPVLQIDMKATNVTLDAKVLPALPHPFLGHYLSISGLLNSKLVSKNTVAELCREQGIDLEIF